MKKIWITIALLLTFSSLWAAPPAPAPNGITVPEGYQNWRLIAVSQRTESQTLRAILGNSIAVDAARSGKTNPWPEGTILAKVNWKQQTSSTFPTAVIPGELVHVDFMLRDSARFASTHGWGWARWLGTEQRPYGNDANFSQECIACHSAMQGHDMVFTEPVKLP